MRRPDESVPCARHSLRLAQDGRHRQEGYDVLKELGCVEDCSAGRVCGHSTGDAARSHRYCSLASGLALLLVVLAVGILGYASHSTHLHRSLALHDDHVFGAGDCKLCELVLQLVECRMLG